MNTSNITELCSATELYTESLTGFSAVNVYPANISMIWCEISSTDMGVDAVSAFNNVTLISQIMTPYVSAL